MASVTLSKVRGEFARGGIRAVARAIANRPVRWWSAYRELLRYRTFEESCALLSYTRALASGWFNPCQIDLEVCGLLDRVRLLRPRVVLEIGTASGGTLFMFTRVAAPDATLISVDLPCGSFGGGYPAWRAPLYRRFALPAQRLHLFRGDSHAADVVEAVKRVLDDRSVDVLFLDGDHSYEGVKRDHSVYGSLVRKGGIIAFHDIQAGDDPATEVPRYWEEIRPVMGGCELIGDPRQKGYGIGLYRVAGSQRAC